MSGNNGAGLVRPSVQALKAYVPGEQPQGAGWIKLNTNENWFVSPSVLSAVVAAATHDLRRYPDPVCTDLREVKCPVRDRFAADHLWQWVRRVADHAHTGDRR